MKATDVFKNLKGFLWEAIVEIEPEDYFEPMYDVSVTETILGPMNELEKALFTIQDDLMLDLLDAFGLEMASEDKVFEFCSWFLYASKEEFESRCYSDKDIDIETAFEIRSQYFFACEFLQLVTAQRFNMNLDYFGVFYRKGFLVTMQKLNLFDTRDN